MTEPRPNPVTVFLKKAQDARSFRYILDENEEPVPEPDLMTWAWWLEARDNHLALDDVKGVRVSTLFLGVDTKFLFTGPPILFETMTFGPDPWDRYQQRHITATVAREFHAKVVAAIEAGEPPESLEEDDAVTEGE